jgi:subtilisin family serine protease
VGIAAAGGTSFATPLVAGTISLMLSVAPNLTPAQVRQIIESTASRSPASLDCATRRLRHGILNAQAAVAARLRSRRPRRSSRSSSTSTRASATTS